MTPDAATEAALDAMSGPFEWGGRDCCLAAALAFDLLHGIDPMAGLHHQYHDRRGAVALIRSSGGLAALCRVQALRAGLLPSVQVPGAIGLLAVGAVTGRALGLCIHPGLWAVKAPRGAAFVNLTPERCWNA